MEMRRPKVEVISSQLEKLDGRTVNRCQLGCGHEMIRTVVVGPVPRLLPCSQCPEELRRTQVPAHRAPFKRTKKSRR